MKKMLKVLIMMTTQLKIAILLIALLLVNAVQAQDLEKLKRKSNTELREGNTLYNAGKYADAEVAYKKAIATYPDNPKAIYNTANAIAQQKRYKEAIAQYEYLGKNAKSKKLKAQAYHNMGNAFMGIKNYQKAVDAYKNSLRLNPTDEETRYNLALAQDLLKKQQQQNKNNKDKDKDKDKNKDKDNKNNKDDKDKNKDKKNDKDKDKKDKGDDKKDKDKDKPDDKNQPPKDKNDQNNKQKEQPQQGKLSPQQIQQLLNALNNEEKKTQDKVNLKKVKGKPVKTEKDW